MKKKHIKKFKPVQEFYSHGETTLLNSKAVGLSNASLEESIVDQASIDVLTKEKYQRQLHSGEASIIPFSSRKNSSTEALQSFDSLKAPGSLEGEIMFQNVSTQSTLWRKFQDVFDCQGDDSSCISKEDVEVMISGDDFGGADHNNATNSSASVGSSCQDILDKSLIDESITNGSPIDHMSVEEGDLNSMRTHSSEAVLPAKGFCEGLDFNSSITSIQKPRLQNQKVMYVVDGSEELVDVRVCDVCGDAGREALLALCSKCNDGAEHIYCMNPKMDKVPESDWLCEECLLIQEPKRHQHAMVERSDNTSTSLCSKEDSPSLSTVVKHVGKMMKIYSSKSSGLSDKRLGSSINASIKPKRTIDKRVQLPKISGSERQARLTQVSSMKNMEKRKDSAHQVSSSVDLAEKVAKQAGSSHHRSPKSKQQFYGGSPNSLEVQCSQEDIDQRRSSSEENAACKRKKKHPDKKVFKSLSCDDVDPIFPDVSNAHSSTPTKKGVKCGRGKPSTEKSSQENKTSPLKQTRVVSKMVKRGSSSRKNVKDKSVIQNEKTNVELLDSLVNEGENDMNALGAGSVEVTKSPCHSSYVVNSPAIIGDSYSDQRVSLSTSEAKIDDNDQSLAYKMPFDFQDVQVMPTLDPADIDHTVPSGISAVPESRCIWKGTFKLDKRGELSSDGYGVQAHMSTHASSKVDELVLNFSTELQLKEVPREHSWPIQFQKNHPTEQDIALYFFAQDLLSYQRSYRRLLDSMIGNDLSLEADFGGFQLLIFPSILLPVVSQRWNSFPYLWGVFRVREDSYFPNVNVFPVNQYLGSPVTHESEKEFDFPAACGSAFASHTSNRSLESSESVDPVVLQSSASMKFRDQISEREVPSPEEYTLKERQLLEGLTVFSDDRRTQGFDMILQSDDLQKGKTISDKNMLSLSNTDIFRSVKSTTPVGFCSDVASGSSLSLDSGPSGLSDSGWFAKSTDEDPFENSGNNTNTLNLDLCLANRSASEEKHVDLDLTLGFPNRSVYQPKDYSKNGSDQDENVSLELSIGMPML